MRTAPIGCFKFCDLNTETKYSLKFGCTTHYNDICAVFTVVCSLLIAKNIQRFSMKEKSSSFNQRMTNDEIDEVIDLAFLILKNELSEGFDFESDKSEIMSFLKTDSYEKSHLCGKRTGCALCATGSAILALRKGINHEQAIEEGVRWAGDTNAAVVGGVIGAVVGFSGIPSEMMKYLFSGNRAFVDYVRMCKVININPSPSPFLKLSFQ